MPIILYNLQPEASSIIWIILSTKLYNDYSNQIHAILRYVHLDAYKRENSSVWQSCVFNIHQTRRNVSAHTIYIIYETIGRTPSAPQISSRVIGIHSAVRRATRGDMIFRASAIYIYTYSLRVCACIHQINAVATVCLVISQALSRLLYYIYENVRVETSSISRSILITIHSMNCSMYIVHI